MLVLMRRFLLLRLLLAASGLCLCTGLPVLFHHVAEQAAEKREGSRFPLFRVILLFRKLCPVHAGEEVHCFPAQVVKILF